MTREHIEKAAEKLSSDSPSWSLKAAFLAGASLMTKENEKLARENEGLEKELDQLRAENERLRDAMMDAISSYENNWQRINIANELQAALHGGAK